MSDFTIQHIQYVTLPPHPDKNSPDDLFRLLDDLDVFERDRMLTWMYLAFLEAPTTEKKTAAEEERLELRYNRFKQKFRHEAIGLFGPFLVHAAVTYTLAYLRECGDRACLNSVLDKLRSSLKMIHRLIAQGTVSSELGEAMVGNLEEQINNVGSEVELARHRYDTFCDRVVKEMSP